MQKLKKNVSIQDEWLPIWLNHTPEYVNFSAVTLNFTDSLINILGQISPSLESKYWQIIVYMCVYVCVTNTRLAGARFHVTPYIYHWYIRSCRSVHEIHSESSAPLNNLEAELCWANHELHFRYNRIHNQLDLHHLSSVNSKFMRKKRRPSICFIFQSV